MPSIFQLIKGAERKLAPVFKILERLRNGNTTATQGSEQKGDPPLIPQLQLHFFTIREIPCVVLPLCSLFVISLYKKCHRVSSVVIKSGK